MTYASMDARPSVSRRAYVPMLILVMLAIALSYVLRSPDVLPIKHVAVYSSFLHLDQKELETTISPFVDTGLFSVNTKSLRNRLLHHPWVQRAHIDRVWPDTIKIAVTEHEPVAQWNGRGLVNRDGEFFQPPNDVVKPNLPLFKAPENQVKHVLQVYEKTSRIVKQLDLSISEVELSASHAWTMRLSNGMTLLLGQQQPVAQVKRLQKVYHRIVGDHAGEIEQVDLRYPHGMAVRWRNHA